MRYYPDCRCAASSVSTQGWCQYGSWTTPDECKRLTMSESAGAGGYRGNVKTAAVLRAAAG
jgi:hypothetical protein